MKKLTAIILALVMVMAASSVFAADIEVSVNGEKVEFDQAPAVIEEVLMLPFRYIAEKLGANVNWNEETKTVFTEYNGSILTLQIGNETIFTGSDAVKVEKAPVIVNSRTLVPAKVLETLAGVTVAYDAEAGTVAVTK